MIQLHYFRALGAAALTSIGIFALFPGEAAAQESVLAIGTFAGPGRVVEYFTSDCCGPTRSRGGISAGGRFRWRQDALVSPGLDFGVTFARGRDMKWAMALATIVSGANIAPWAHVGAGVVLQPGECPADSSDTDPACSLNFNLGGQAAVGILWRFAARWGIGSEVAVITGAPIYRDRWITTQRVGILLRYR